VHPRSAPIKYYISPEPEVCIRRILFPGGYFDIQVVDDHRARKQQGRRHHKRQEVAAGEMLPETESFGIGSYGPGVEQLQWFLISHKLMSPRAIAWRAGLYGPWTRRAIANFQNAEGLAVTELGQFDKTTRAALLSHVADKLETEPEPEPEPETAPNATGTEQQEQQEQQVTATPPPPAKWADELAVLRNMGFADTSALTNLLERKHGQIDLVVAEILQ